MDGGATIQAGRGAAHQATAFPFFRVERPHEDSIYEGPTFPWRQSANRYCFRDASGRSGIFGCLPHQPIQLPDPRRVGGRKSPGHPTALASRQAQGCQPAVLRVHRHRRLSREVANQLSLSRAAHIDHQPRDGGRRLLVVASIMFDSPGEDLPQVPARQSNTGCLTIFRLATTSFLCMESEELQHT